MSIEQTLSIIKPDATSRNITGQVNAIIENSGLKIIGQKRICLLYTSPSPRDGCRSRMPSSA